MIGRVKIQIVVNMMILFWIGTSYAVEFAEQIEKALRDTPIKEALQDIETAVTMDEKGYSTTSLRYTLYACALERLTVYEGAIFQESGAYRKNIHEAIKALKYAVEYARAGDSRAAIKAAETANSLLQSEEKILEESMSELISALQQVKEAKYQLVQAMKEYQLVLWQGLGRVTEDRVTEESMNNEREAEQQAYLRYQKALGVREAARQQAESIGWLLEVADRPGGCPEGRPCKDKDDEENQPKKKKG